VKKGIALGQVLSNDGQTTVFGARDLDALRRSKAQIVRMEFRAGSQPQWDKALLKRYDAIVDQIRRAGPEIIGLLSHQIVPGASQAAWNANNSENGGSPDRDDPFRNQYVAASTQIVKAFPSIRSWEIWNEPNAWTEHPAPPVFTGATYIYPSVYAALLRAAIPAIKKAQRRARVITGGLFCHNIGGNLNPDSSGATHLAAVFQHLAAGSALIDSIGVHPYLDRGGRLDRQHLAAALELIDRAIAQSGRRSNRKLYVTEAGWQSPPLAPDVHAANLQTLFQHCAKSRRVEAACWFQIADNPAARLSFGLCRADYTPKPAFDAFRRV
jgi:hypothetical protein